ncbi:hypothetical protein BROUX41_004341 [Berkeleyomyces rouxiae]|uniref:uncharacterized protein n=1 Tax=Berkeleyomyces rouxiae TaxID=2035830 RepID=UPI003B7F0432
MRTPINSPPSADLLVPDQPLSKSVFETSSSLLSLFSRCCVSWAPCFESQSSQPNPPTNPKPFVEQKQPVLTPKPVLPTVPDASVREVGLGAYTTHKPLSSSGSISSMRSVLDSWKKKQRERSGTASSNRSLQISAPTNFRHVASQSFSTTYTRMSETMTCADSERPLSLHLLELTIHEPARRLSPLMSHFRLPETAASVGPSDHHSKATWDMTERPPSRAMTFHIPRRAIYTPQCEHQKAIVENQESENDTCDSPQCANFGSTIIKTEDVVERIASALIEKECLERAIEDCIERESIYFNSRPSTAVSRVATISDMTDIQNCTPSVPALPPIATCFSQRVHHTNPLLSISPSSYSPMMSGSLPQTPATLYSPFPTVSDSSPIITTITPPLPLVLRPPLRKKQPFSRVSSWFSKHQHSRHDYQKDLSLDSVTNSPRPTTGRDGFYQCFTPPLTGDRSFDEMSVPDWDSENDVHSLKSTQTWTAFTPPMSRHTTRGVASIDSSSLSPLSKVKTLPSVGAAF